MTKLISSVLSALVALCLFAPAALAQGEAAAEAKKDQKKTVGERPAVYASTMFYNEEMERIDLIIELLKNREPLPEETSSDGAVEAPAAQEAPAVTRYTYPQFYLRSLVYHRPNQWVVWLNNKKITSEVPDSILGLTVKSISRERVTLSYNYAGDSMVADKATAAVGPVTVNQYDESVDFTLSANQTFSLYNFNIYEGRVAPATVLIKAKSEEPEPAKPLSAINPAILLGGEDEL